MSTTNEELEREVQSLKTRIENLELDIQLLKISRVQEPCYPVQPWVTPVVPVPYWQNPIVTYCRS